MNTETFDEPLEVKICDGEVVMAAHGRPFSVALTARAALKTGQALSDAAKRVLAD